MATNPPNREPDVHPEQPGSTPDLQPGAAPQEIVPPNPDGGTPDPHPDSPPAPTTVPPPD